jgi:hypothetical protein
MNYYLLMYIFACVAIGSGGSMFLMQSGRTISAATFFIGALLIFIFFGLRWFQYSPDITAATAWPPVINTCPDYLVYFERKITGSGGQATVENTCVDPLGVSTKPDALFKWPGAQPADDKPEYYFSLEFPEMDPLKLAAAKCERSLQKGVSWEGITDGETCYKYKAPSAGGGGGGSGGNCPTV